MVGLLGETGRMYESSCQLLHGTVKILLGDIVAIKQILAISCDVIYAIVLVPFMVYA